jgi:hypothetical protein
LEHVTDCILFLVTALQGKEGCRDPVLCIFLSFEIQEQLQRGVSDQVLQGLCDPFVLLHAQFQQSRAKYLSNTQRTALKQATKKFP